MIVFALLFGCSDLTPNEVVLGDEVLADTVEYSMGFGATVALSKGLILAANGLRWGPVDAMREQHTSGEVRTVGFSGDIAWAWLESGRVVLIADGAEIGRVHSAASVDVCPDLSLVSAQLRGEAVACSDEGLIRTHCDEDVCTVSINGEDLPGNISAGGAVAWVEGTACWGSPQLQKEQGRGLVECEDGRVWQGLRGDHLGLAIGGGRTAGRFNRHIVPPRLRIPSLVGDETWLIDRAAENSRVSLSGDSDATVVGVPRYRQGGTTGRVYVVESP